MLISILYVFTCVRFWQYEKNMFYPDIFPDFWYKATIIYFEARECINVHTENQHFQFTIMQIKYVNAFFNLPANLTRLRYGDASFTFSSVKQITSLIIESDLDDVENFSGQIHAMLLRAEITPHLPNPWVFLGQKCCVIKSDHVTSPVQTRIFHLNEQNETLQAADASKYFCTCYRKPAAI